MVEMHTDGLFVHGNSLDRLQLRIALLETLVMYHDPVVATHLAGCGVSGPLYSSRWLITLFADVLPLSLTAALWDALFTLGRGFLPCFAAAIVLQHRDSLLATATQTSLLLFFSQLNSTDEEQGQEQEQGADAPRIDVSACLARALSLYATTPGDLLRAWDGEEGTPRRRTTSDIDTQFLPPLVEPPVVLERPTEVTVADLLELVAEAKAATAAAAIGPTAAGQGASDGPPPVSPRCRLGVLLLDARDFSLEDHSHYGGDGGGGADGDGPLPAGVPSGCPRLRLPWTCIRGHAGFCSSLVRVQQEMRPPPALRPFVGKAHIVVYAGLGSGATTRARAVARMLVLSRVPFVSIYTPQPAVATTRDGSGGGNGGGGGR
jgi:hypothetical protein